MQSTTSSVDRPTPPAGRSQIFETGAFISSRRTAETRWPADLCVFISASDHMKKCGILSKQTAAFGDVSTFAHLISQSGAWAIILKVSFAAPNYPSRMFLEPHWDVYLSTSYILSLRGAAPHLLKRNDMTKIESRYCWVKNKAPVRSLVLHSFCTLPKTTFALGESDITLMRYHAI